MYIYIYFLYPNKVYVEHNYIYISPTGHSLNHVSVLNDFFTFSFHLDQTKTGYFGYDLM